MWTGRLPRSLLLCLRQAVAEIGGMGGKGGLRGQTKRAWLGWMRIRVGEKQGVYELRIAGCSVVGFLCLCLVGRGSVSGRSIWRKRDEMLGFSGERTRIDQGFQVGTGRGSICAS